MERGRGRVVSSLFVADNINGLRCDLLMSQEEALQRHRTKVSEWNRYVKPRLWVILGLDPLAIEIAGKETQTAFDSHLSMHPQIVKQSPPGPFLGA